MKRLCILLVPLLIILPAGCGSLMSAAMPIDIPNPFADEKGINTDVAIGQNVSTVKKKQVLAVEVADIGRDNSIKNNTATTMTNNYTNVNWWLIAILCIAVGMVIPTRGQYMQNKLLKEQLSYEREREKS